MQEHTALVVLFEALATLWLLAIGLAIDLGLSALWLHLEARKAAARERP